MKAFAVILCVCVAVVLFGLVGMVSLTQDMNRTDQPAAPHIPDASVSPTLVFGPTSVRVTGVVASKAARSQESKLRIYLNVENVSKNAKFYYSGWGNQFAGASLQDDLGNRYHSQDGFGNDREGVRGGSLYPGDRVQETLVFEFPVPSAKFLTLTLPGSYIGQQQDMRFKIPRSMWEPAASP